MNIKTQNIVTGVAIGVIFVVVVAVCSLQVSSVDFFLSTVTVLSGLLSPLTHVGDQPYGA